MCCIQTHHGLCVAHRLIIGYVFHADGRMDAVTESSLNLYEMGEDGNDPTDFEIDFVAGSTFISSLSAFCLITWLH